MIHSTRHILCAAMASLVFFGQRTYSAEPKAPVALQEHLKPLRAYPGTWQWTWKDEHGESMQGQSIVTADPSGAFLIDRVSDVQNGKLTPTELNIYYWRSEAKTIGSIGFTSSGDHGSSSVFIRGNQWVEQSLSYDAAGVLRSHVDQWQWPNSDTGLYQETHVVRAGSGEPDNFKYHCQRSSVAGIAPAQSNEPSALGEHLQPLARLLGDWELSWTNKEGVLQKGRARVQSEAGGAVLTESIEQMQDGTFVTSELTVFYWQAESKCLATITLDAAGGSLAGPLYLRGDKWVYQLSGYDGQGNVQTRVGQHQWINPDSATYRELHRFAAGQAGPDSPIYHFTRIPH